MLALDELQEAWPFAGWVHQMFLRIMEDLTGDDIKKVGPNRQVSQTSVLDKYGDELPDNHQHVSGPNHTVVDESRAMLTQESTLRPLPVSNNESGVPDMGAAPEGSRLLGVGGDNQLSPDLSYEDFDMGPFGLDFPAQLTFWNDLSTMNP
jgi:hypothetical protein